MNNIMWSIKLTTQLLPSSPINLVVIGQSLEVAQLSFLCMSDQLLGYLFTTGAVSFMRVVGRF